MELWFVLVPVDSKRTPKQFDSSKKRFMRSLSLQHLLFLFVVVGVTVSPASRFTFADERSAQIDRIFADYDKPESPGCAVAVIQQGQVIHQRGYGQAHLEWNSPITPQTVFPVASLSKQFTAMAVALLAEQGLLSLDDDLRKHVPELPDYGSVITLRHLLQHTSGLRDVWSLGRWAGWRPNDLVTNHDIVRLAIRQQGIDSKPGERFVYNNTGYTLLPLVVERVSGKSFRDFVELKIFEPLGMKQSHFHDDIREVVNNRASAYSAQSGKFQIDIPTYSTVGTTGLFTTLEDLVRWDQNFYDRRVGGTSALDQMLSLGKLNDGGDVRYGIGLSYGLGLVIGQYRGLKSVSHSGLDWGYSAEFLQFPEQHLTIIVLGNVNTLHPYLRAREVADCLLAAEFPGAGDQSSPQKQDPDPNPVELTADELAVWSGKYCNLVDGSSWSFSVVDGKLCLHLRELTPLTANRFAIGGTPIELVFSPATDRTPRKLAWVDVDVQEFEAVPEVVLTETDLHGYAGSYESEELNTTYAIEIRNGKLLVRGWRDEFGSLIPIIPDGFSLKPPLMPSAFFRFTRDADNRVTGFSLNTSGAGNIRFVRLGE
jgi:CubicO group peptidase (beta-lactamase class C family)